MSKKVSFHTLGCKLNFSETSTIARQFSEGGFERATGKGGADICVINTCSVTENADKKCRNLIRRLIKENPGAIIAVTGCYAQLRPQDISSIEGVDLVIGNSAKGELYRQVSELSLKKGAPALVYGCGSGEVAGFFAAFSTGDRTRAFLKVQDGCSYKCTYCTIPYARGESRNIPAAEIVEEARKIAANGQKEVVITGINTGDFGRTTGESFADLLRELDKTEGIERYRISSIEPNLLTDEIIGITLGSDKFMPHFHIPLQSGCDSVLGRMRRRYSTSLFAERVQAVRRAMPDAFIGIDVIVGFPGETDAEFQATYEFLKVLAPSYLHIFPYSERPGTPAADLEGKVPKSVTAQRVRLLGELCGELHTAFAQKHLGSRARVLFESNIKEGKISGFTDNYIKVFTPYRKQLVNRIVEVELTARVNSGDMEGMPVENIY